MNLMTFLKARYAEELRRGSAWGDAGRRLMAEILEYESRRDAEFGCCCEAEEIAAGECECVAVDEIPALRALALPFAGHPDFEDRWRLRGHVPEWVR